MKKRRLTLLLSLFVCISFSLFAQDDTNRCYLQRQPLSFYAYQRMMRNHYNFTILGSQAPVSGFKVETNKPTVTIKGNIYSSNQKKLLVNLELTGGADNDLLQVFAGDKLNGYFKANLGFNILLSKQNGAKYILDDNFNRMMLRKKACEYREVVARQIDTVMILSAVGDFIASGQTSLSEMVSHLMTDGANPPYKIKNYTRPVSGDSLRAYYRRLVIAVIKTYDTTADPVTDENLFASFIDKLKERHNRSLNSSKLISDLTRLTRFKTDSIYKYELIDNNEIETYKDVWISKRIAWFNISAAGANTSLQLYDAPSNMLTDANSFVPALSITYNYFEKWTAASKYFFIRTGFTFKKVNSIIDMSKFDYTKETLINVTPTDQLASTKAGTAYQGKLANGVGFEVPVEMYAAPWNQAAVPGFYAKLMYSYGDPWINKNKVSLDLGIIWNVLNGDPESKSVLTIVPYVSWLDLIKEYKDVARTVEKPLSDLFSAGIKIGIPVNVGK